MEVIRFPSNIQQLTVRSNLAIREELLSHPYILRDQSSAETLSMIILLVLGSIAKSGEHFLN